MSSANAVQLTVIPEASYGVTPPLAAAEGGTVRFITEAMSGTPTTTASQENRTDRMSGGQIVTGLEVGGPITGELSADAIYQMFFQMGMMSPPVPAEAPLALSAGTYIKDATNPQLAEITITAGDFSTLAVGQAILLSGFVAPAEANNGPSTITEIAPGGLSATITTKREAITVDPIPAGAASAAAPAYLDIGAEIFSATVSKAYTDVLHLAGTDEHSQRYSGAIVNGFSVDLTYGELVGVVFNFLANGYLQEHPSLAQQVEVAGGTIAEAGTAEVLNASIDMGMITIDGAPTEFCIESLTIALDNGNTPQNCLGKAAPTRYNPGTAAISVDASIYLADPAYDAFMPGKLKATPIGMFFAVGNDDGGYAFEMPAVQLSFPDPSVTGQNAPVMIAATGLAKVGDGGASALRVYYW